MIIDVRNNCGGSSDQGWSLLRHLTDKPLLTSKWSTRQYKPAYRAWGRHQEDFALAFDVMDRGSLIGQATGGSTGQPLSFTLPGGGGARVCTKRDRYPDGTEFIGIGILPDIIIAPTIKIKVSGKAKMKNCKKPLTGSVNVNPNVS